MPRRPPDTDPPVVPESSPPTYFVPVTHPPSYWRIVAHRASLRAVVGADVPLADPAVALGHYLGRWRRRAGDGVPRRARPGAPRLRGPVPAAPRLSAVVRRRVPAR